MPTATGTPKPVRRLGRKSRGGNSKTLNSAVGTRGFKMTSLKEVRNQLFIIISHEGVLNDEEFLLLYDLSRSNNLDLPYDSYPDFTFDDLEDDKCLLEFRFHKRFPKRWSAIKEASVVDWRLFVVCSKDIAILADTPTW